MLISIALASVHARLQVSRLHAAVMIYIYIFIYTKCSNKNNKKMISNNKDALSVSGALVARRLK